MKVYGNIMMHNLMSLDESFEKLFYVGVYIVCFLTIFNHVMSTKN